MVTISVARAYPSANELFKQIPSSHGEFTLQFETRTFRQQSISMPSRFVSIFTLSIVRLSTPVARIPKCPPDNIEISRIVTLRQSFRAIALLPPVVLASLVKAFPLIRPFPVMATLARFSPQNRLLCQWL